MVPLSIKVITRPKLGFATHWGVLLPEGVVAEFSQEHGLRITSLAVFSQGLPVKIVKEVPWHLAAFVRARLEEVRRNPRQYDLLAWNCETFAEWLTSGIPKSGQVVGAVILVGIAIAVAFAARG
jgi:hypothetical protein